MRKPYYYTARKAWYIRTPKDDGKLQTIRLGSTKKEAYDTWRKLLAAAETEAGLTERSVDSLIDLFTTARESAVKDGEANAAGVERKLGYVSDFAEFVGEAMTPSTLKPHHVHEWLASKQDRWNVTTRYDAGSAVKRAMQWAVEQGYIERNPVASVKLPKGKGRDFVLTPEAFAKLLSGWKQWKRAAYDFRLLLIALHQTGCRPGEIIGVDVEHVSDDCKTWTLPIHKTRKKKQRPRMVYLSPCMQTLTRILSAGRSSGPLFRNPSGERWGYHDIRRTFSRLRERSGTDKKCVLYSFRHTWITQALVSGVDVATVAEMAGTSIQMIDRHYGHLSKHRDHMYRAAVTVANSWSAPERVDASLPSVPSMSCSPA